MKRSCQQELLHINRLPKELVTEILCRLPIKDAVKTSVLSKKWRYTWTELPLLVFDDKFCEGFIKNSKIKIIGAICQVLMLRRGPLDKFVLSLAKLGCCGEIDQLVLFVLRAGVKALIIKRPDAVTYRLPSSIFAYGQQLEALELSYCVFKPPAEFNGFSKLVNLEFQGDVSGHALSSLISNCPLLEKLNFQSYTDCGQLAIVAPNLKKFSFRGLCDSICFTNTPKLAFVSIFSTYKCIHLSGHCKLSGRLPVIIGLHLDYYYLKYMAANGATISLVNDLCHLEDLHLYNIYFRNFDEVSSALCLVKNAKNLEILTIKVTIHTKYSAPDLDLTKVESFSEFTFDHLRKFNLLGVSGSKCEMQLIELILAKSPVLEECLIAPTLVGEKGCKFSKELSRFRRASPHVEIDYEDFYVD